MYVLRRNRHRNLKSCSVTSGLSYRQHARNSRPKCAHQTLWQGKVLTRLKVRWNSFLYTRGIHSWFVWTVGVRKSS